MKRQQGGLWAILAAAAILLLLCFGGSALADSGTMGDGIAWVLEDGVLTLTGSGAIPDYTYQDTAKPWGAPGTVEKVALGDGITRIGKYAFYNESRLTEIELSATVSEIDAGAFYGTGVKELVFPEGATSLDCVYDLSGMTVCFPSTMKTVFALQMTSGGTIVAPPALQDKVLNKVTRCNLFIVTDYKNKECKIQFYSSLSGAEVVMPDSVLGYTVTAIGDQTSYRNVFGNTVGIRKVVLPAQLEGIGKYAFYSPVVPEGKGIQTMEIPESVTEIGEGAFTGMSEWTVSRLPDGIQKIGKYAFRKVNLSNLQELPAGCVEMGDQAFSQCGLTGKLTLPAGLQTLGADCFAENEITEVVFPFGMTQIASGAFSDNQLTSLTLPEGVTGIGTNAFENNQIASLTLPSTLKTIDMCAFRQNPELSDINLPEGLQSIGSGAFEKTGLTAVEIPSGVTYLYMPFDKSVLLAVVKGSAAETAIRNSNYSIYTVAYLDNAKLWTSILSTADKTCAVTGYSGSESMLAIPKEINGYRVTAIGSNAFSGNKSLTAVALPYTVTSIGDSAFGSCSKLAKINLPAGLREIGERAFWFASELELTEGSLPESLQSIGSYAFSYTKFREALHFTNQRTVGRSAFDGTWISEVFVADGITEVPDGLCRGMGRLTAVHLPEGLQKVGTEAFRECGLTSVSLPESVTEIGESAFADCASLASFVFPAGMTEIKAGTFSGCAGLQAIEIPERITAIGEGAFSACAGLTEVTLPEGITEIARYTFRDCTGLTAVNCPESLESIGYAAFEGCDALTSFSLDCSVRVAEFAFGNALAELTVTGSGAVTAEWAEPLGVSLDGCRAITISGPESVETGALSSFTNLHSILLGDSVTELQAGCLNAPFADATLTMPESLWAAACPEGNGDPFIRGVQYLFQGNPLRLGRLVLVREDGREIVVDAPLLQASPTPVPTPRGDTVSFSGSSGVRIVFVERGSKVYVNTDSLTWYMDAPNMDHFKKPSTFAAYNAIYSSLGNRLTFDTTDAPSTWVITLNTYTYSTVDVNGRPGYVIGDPKGVFGLTIYVEDFVVTPATPDPTPVPTPGIRLTGGETVQEIQPGHVLRLGSAYEYEYTVSPDDPALGIREEGRTAEGDLVLAMVAAQDGDYELRYTLYEREYEDAQVIWRFNYDPPRRIVVYPYRKGEKVAEGVLMIRAAELTALLLPKGLETIGEEAFAGVDTQKVLVASTVREIGPRAFAGCPDLREVHLPKDVTFCEDTFADNPNLVLYLPAGGRAEEKAIEYGIPYVVE